MKRYIGIDGGGTKTELVITDEACHEFGRWLGGSTNPHSIGFDAAVNELRALLKQAAAAHGDISAEDSWGVALGMAGVDTLEERTAMAAAVKKAVQDLIGDAVAVEVTVTNDAEIALMATLDRESGMLAIAGTGSIVYGVTPEGERFRVGGWGHLLGDEGSGYRIGLDTLQTVIRSYDGVLPATAMTGLIEKAYDFRVITELKGYIYRADIKKQDIADFARFAIIASQEGDELAKQLIVRNALELAGHTYTLIGKHAWFLNTDLVVSGSIFKHSPLYHATFREKLSSAYPLVRIHEAVRSPAYGAARLAAVRHDSPPRL